LGIAAAAVATSYGVAQAQAVANDGQQTRGVAAAPLSAASSLSAADDTPQVTSFGIAFTLPKDWTAKNGSGWVDLRPPEEDSDLVIVDVGEAKDGVDAAAKAWALFRPGGMTRKVLLTPALPARRFWDGGTQVVYEASPNEHRQVVAIALSKGVRWTVALIDANPGTLEKRAAATGLIIGTLRSAGEAPKSFSGVKAHNLDAERIATLKAFVETSMRELKVPGAAIALIDHDQVVFEGGFGVKELGKPDVVDAHTLFMVASNTKGMTTLLLARLVDQGELKWDEPATQAYPAFRLGSEAITRQVLMKHLVCACTGLPRKDFEMLFNTPRGTLARNTFTLLAATEPTSKFGEVFQYNNLMASAAGFIGGHLVYPNLELGAAYDKAMQTLVFDPLGMTETTFDYGRALGGNHASPHAPGPDGAEHLASLDVDYEIFPYRPAGGAWSSVHDIIKYVRNELDEGRLPDGGRLVSAQNLLQRRVKSVPLGEQAWYGMGLMVDQSYGVDIVSHGGDLFGYHSDWYAIPEAGVGAVIMVNSDEGQPLVAAFRRRLLEVLYNAKPLAEGQVKAAAAATQSLGFAKMRELVSDPPDVAAAAALARHYVNPDLGRIDVRSEGPNVIFDVGAWKSRVVTHKSPDGAISFITIDPGVPHVGFSAGTAGGKRQLTVRDGQHVYIYNEAP
jgi:CubicO group peptidase (beta-lactamase class C family)